MINFCRYSGVVVCNSFNDLMQSSFVVSLVGNYNFTSSAFYQNFLNSSSSNIFTQLANDSNFLIPSNGASPPLMLSKIYYFRYLMMLFDSIALIYAFLSVKCVVGMFILFSSAFSRKAVQIGLKVSLVHSESEVCLQVFLVHSESFQVIQVMS